MTDSDYELWAAMMADDEAASVTPAALVSETQQVFADTEPEVVFEQKFFPLTPVAPPVPQIVDFEVRVDQFVPAVEDLENEDENQFPANLFKEPQTNSITVTEVPDALSADIVTGSGEILKTGAIDMPLLSNTGSIPIITIPTDEINEEAIKAAMGDETTGGIPPIRSGSVMNSSARVGVLPIKNRRSEGQTVLLATTSILLVALGAGLIAAYMFKLI
jgi:hypothetical protein